MANKYGRPWSELTAAERESCRADSRAAVARRAVLVAAYSCEGCGAPAGQECRPEYGCTDMSRAMRDTAPAVIPPAVAAALVDVAPTIALALETLALVDDNHGPAVDTAMQWLITAAGGRRPAAVWPCETCGGAVAPTMPPICTDCGAVQTKPPAGASYCGDCGETYTAGAVAKRCDRHAAERTARIAAWRAAGGSGAHYIEHDETEGNEL